MTATEESEPDPLLNPAPARTPTKTQVTRLSGRDVLLLEENAERLGTDATEASRRAIRHSNWLLSLADKGQTLLLRDDESGQIREVVLLQ